MGQGHIMGSRVVDTNYTDFTNWLIRIIGYFDSLIREISVIRVLKYTS